MFFFIIYPIEIRYAMPYGNDEVIIEGIHSVLAEDQGLIKFKSGKTRTNKQFVYSIVKSKMKTDGWFFDPYDKKYQKGLRMNLSEKEEYDSMFTGHPLSEMRL